MADASVEKTLKSLKREINSLKRELERAKAVNEIQNLMSTYEYLHTANRHQDVCKLFAKKAPGVRVYFGEVGYWEGPDAPQRAWSILERMGDTTGMMALHPISTSVIEVAADGKTAKGVWIGTGVVANVRGGKPGCNWEWDKYGIDFIKEDGEWKIWHHHIYRLLHGLGWDDKWADQFSREPHVFKVPDDIPIDGPSLEDNPYTPDTKQMLIPEPPKPFKTWKDTKMY